MLIKKTNVLTGAVTYFTSSLTDTAPIDIASPPIEIYSFTVTPITSILTITYSMPSLYSGNFYIRFD